MDMLFFSLRSVHLNILLLVLASTFFLISQFGLCFTIQDLAPIFVQLQLDDFHLKINISSPTGLEIAQRTHFTRMDTNWD